jgi:hypothetical protein
MSFCAQSALLLQVCLTGSQNVPAPICAGLQNLLLAFDAQLPSVVQNVVGLFASTHICFRYSVSSILVTCGIGARPPGRGVAAANVLRVAAANSLRVAVRADNAITAIVNNSSATIAVFDRFIVYNIRLLT